MQPSLTIPHLTQNWQALKTIRYVFVAQIDIILNCIHIFQAIVAWRKGNKVALALSAMIPDDFQDSGDILTGFGLEFVYTNTVPALEHREFQKVEVVVPVYVILGKISN